ncbi:MAG: hypothetical protein HY555_05980 [Euryarchaeota archaeon]|nr:hypothetical protein [Euryarchaeota archaeon]
MERRKVRVNIHDAVMAVVGGNKGKQSSIDRKTLKKIREALRAGNWKISPRYETGL